MAHSPPQQQQRYNDPAAKSGGPSGRQAASVNNAARKTSGQSGTSSKSSGNSKEKGDPKMIGPWRIGRTIGKGSSGRVKIAKHVHTSQLAAVKIVPKHALLSSRLSINEAGAKNDKLLLGIEREIVIMKLIEHPSVLRLFDVWETGSELYLVMEYVEGGELFDYLVSRGRLHADEALHYFQQIIAGVDYCHRFNICHRDLKPENLLLDRERNIKIADFGMAALERNDKLLETSCGSPHYASPEIVSGLTYHGSSSDIWSCGIILFALLTGRLPFDDENIRNLLAKVKLGRFNMPQELPTDAKDLIRKMLEVDPAKRITMEQIVVHPWFTRRAPRPVGDVVAPPTPDQMIRPIGTVNELDPDILSNLKTLWHGTSEAEIIKTLTSNTKSWQKVFYILLLRYRTKHLENFNMDDEEQAPQRRSSQRRQIEEVAPPVREEKPARPTTAPRVAYPTQVSRPAPAVPSASAARAPPASPRPLPQAPSSAKRDTPRKPIPSIILQEASPYYVEPEVTRTSRPASVASSTATSPVLQTGNFVTPGSPTPSIQIPDTGNEAMQRFFHDIVDQLHTISTRPSPTLPFPSPALSDRSSFASSSYTQSPVDLDEGNQFEDADEESVGSPTMQPPTIVQPLSENRAAIALNNPIVPGRLSLRNPARPAAARPGPRPNSAFAAMSAPVVPARPQYPYQDGSADKENASGARRGANSANTKAALGLAISGGGQVDIFGTEGAANSRIAKKQKASAPVPAPATQFMASPIMSMGSSQGPVATKGSWFASLFNWKQLTYVLQSYERADATRAECKRLLEMLGAQVIMEGSERSAILKCRIDELRDQSSSAPLRPVRFKVEFTSQNNAGNPLMSPSSQRAQYACTSTLVMEKGAHSTFKAISNQLRRHWQLDQSSPAQGYANMR